MVNPPDSMRVDDTLDIQVRVLNRSGDSIPGAPVELISLQPDTISIHPGRIAIVGEALGPGDIIARSGDLPSAPFRVLVKP